ncbi:MAG: hypothetical protein CME46_02870 [Halieaceae bacterium]|nr:hypothetical protein [Halieaceae bacterium]MDG1931534.1 DUF3299 domain-containing protein [Luminiphilus sp.]MDG2037425.1 DUF3299 domain-containing protein [Luminiphilus sp.]|tara:strand:+ start:1644 stop:2240 length:597 start_codon:yes stop_codon:yes gene_type:complete
MEVLKSLPLYFLVVALATFSSTIFAQDGDSISAEETQFQTVEWVDLIPPEVLEILLNPPAYISEIEDGSPEDQITSQISNATLEEEEDVYQRALASTDVNTELDGQSVRIPGFVVPLEFDEAQTISQFFLVPYFGACLHMPPPPPNQIILVDAPAGVQMAALYEPFWIEGQISTTVSENDMAKSAYAMQLHRLTPYRE